MRDSVVDLKRFKEKMKIKYGEDTKVDISGVTFPLRWVATNTGAYGRKIDSMDGRPYIVVYKGLDLQTLKVNTQSKAVITALSKQGKDLSQGVLEIITESSGAVSHNSNDRLKWQVDLSKYLSKKTNLSN